MKAFEHERAGRFDRERPGIDLELRIHRRLVRVVEPRELGDLSPARAGVESLHVAAFAFLQRRRDVDLDEALTQLANAGA